MKSSIKYLLLLIVASLTFMACGDNSTDPEDKEPKSNFYKLGKVTFEYDGKTTTIEDFYIDGLTVLNFVDAGIEANNIATAVFKAKDSTTSVLFGLNGVDVKQNSFAGTYKIEDAEAVANFTWGENAEYSLGFTSGDAVVEKMDKDGSVKITLVGKGNFIDLSNNEINVIQEQPAKLTIDAKLLTVYVNNVKQ